MWTTYSFSPRPARLVGADGRATPLEVARWLGPPTPVEEALLAGVRGPVLDVGCGPGRLTAALHRRGVPALGIDVAPAAVALARRRGARALRRSVFDPLPCDWATVLLVDGNVGLGGDPGRLLARVAELLAPGGTVVAEVEPPGADTRRVLARLETGGALSGWSPWAHVGADGIGALAGAAGLRLRDRWEGEGRWFAQLTR